MGSAMPPEEQVLWADLRAAQALPDRSSRRVAVKAARAALARAAHRSSLGSAERIRLQAR